MSENNNLSRSDPTVPGRVAFVREAERLKSVLRSAHTAAGRRESTAEHSWRLTLLAMAVVDLVPGADVARVLKLCVLHDLGEAIAGDVPAVEQRPDDGRSARERRDLMTLMGELPASLRDEFLALWDDYECGGTPEARLVKGLDKLETIIQHNQGANPPGFDYLFNLEYGRKQTDAHPLTAAIRELVDADTRASAAGAARPAPADGD